jgi:hypothetical protein
MIKMTIKTDLILLTKEKSSISQFKSTFSYLWIQN